MKDWREVNYWFADVASEDDDIWDPGREMWIPCFQAQGSCHALNGLGFYTEDQCISWMRSARLNLEGVIE